MPFSTALRQIATWQAQETADPRLNPACLTRLWHHDAPTARVVLLLHGITASPVQFADLADYFFSRGYTVLVPRLPRHGFRDRLTDNLAHLTAPEYARFTDDVVSLCAGLGNHLTVAGLSVSGVLTAYAAQRRPEVHLAVLIAAAFAPMRLPYALVPTGVRTATALPNRFVWWDHRKRERAGIPCHYPRFSTHALAEAFRLGRQVYHEAAARPPAARRIIAVNGPRDPAVNNAATRAVLRRWHQHGTTAVREVLLGPQIGRLHDVIGPYQDFARIDYIYPLLFDLIDASA